MDRLLSFEFFRKDVFIRADTDVLAVRNPNRRRPWDLGRKRVFGGGEYLFRIPAAGTLCWLIGSSYGYFL